MNNIIISYKTLRTVIGLLGMLLGFICIIGGIIKGIPIQESISDYYHTGMRDILEGLLITIGVFLLTYKGYDLTDNIVTAIAGISILGVAFFPCKLYQIPHVFFAILFFLALAYMTYFQFSKSHNKYKNNIYKICGVIIIVSMLFVLLLHNIKYSILMLEIIMLNAFGISWLLKGDIIA